MHSNLRHYSYVDVIQAAPCPLNHFRPLAGRLDSAPRGFASSPPNMRDESLVVTRLLPRHTRR